MHIRSRRQPGCRRGTTMLLILFLMTVVIGLIAFAVDVGRMYLVRAQLQTAVDAGALAAGLKLREDKTDVTGAVAAAKDFVRQNRVGWLSNVPEDAIIIEPGVWNSDTRTFTATTVDPEVVRVRARQDQDPVFFGKVFGTTSFGVPREAIASMGGGTMDIMMTLDLSGSMGGQGRIEALQNAAPTFVDVLEAVGDNDRVGVMGYGAVKGKYDPAAKGHGGSPYVDGPVSLDPGDGWIGVLEAGLTYDLAGLKSTALSSTTLTANKYNGWTPIGGALRDTAHYLNTNARSTAKKVIVLMSDGHANKPAGNGPGFARTAASYAQASDITVYTISLGNAADEQLMEEIAAMTGGEHFLAAGSDSTTLTAKLTEAFKNIAGSMKGTQLVK